MPKLSHGQWLLLIFAVALLLRVVTVGQKSLWLDEAFGVHHAQRQELAVPTWVEHTHPPLYYTFLHYWIPLAGNSEAAVRLPSVAVSLAGIGLLYLLARMLFDRQVAAVAAALLALSPLDVWYAQEARMYIFITFFGLILAIALNWSRPISTVLIAIAVGAGLYFDYLMLPLWTGLTAVWLVSWSSQKNRGLSLLYWIAGSAAGWWLFGDWWPHFEVALEKELSNVFIFAQLRARLGLPQLTMAHFFAALGTAAAGVVVISSVSVTLLQRKPWRRAAILAVVLVFVLITILMMTPRLYSVKRILVTGWPYVLLLLAWLVVHAEEYRRWLQPLLMGISIIGTLTVLGQPKDDWRGATSFVESQAVRDVTVWLDPSSNTFPYEYYSKWSLPETGSVESLAARAGQVDEIWLVAERYPALDVPSSPSELWLDQHWVPVHQQPFHRLEVRAYHPP